MKLLQDAVIAFLATVGLAALFWMAANALRYRMTEELQRLVVVLPLAGSAPGLEEDYRELCRLRCRYPNARLVFADCGLTEERRLDAEWLCETDGNAAVQDGLRVEWTGE